MKSEAMKYEAVIIGYRYDKSSHLSIPVAEVKEVKPVFTGEEILAILYAILKL